MKVCFLGQDNLPVLAREYNHHGVGGAQLQMTLIARALVSHGFDVSMVVADHGQEDGAVWHGVKTYKTYKPEEGLPIFRFIYPRWTKTWSALTRANADVYFTSCAGMHVGLLALFCGTVEKRFVFRLAHDNDADPKKVLIRLWRDKKLYEYGLKQARCILCQNNQQLERLAKNYSLNANLVRSLVEPPVINFPFSDRWIEILWVSNLRDIKRPDLALELARQLPEHQIHMVGGSQPGFPEMYKTIEQEAANLQNLTFHGPVPYHEVGDLYDRAKVFVNTSDSEGFPNSYLQAWRRGVPVVAFFDPDGLLVKEGLGYAVETLEDMARAVEKLLGDDTEWHACSTRCRNYMDRHHSDDVVLKPYIKALEYAYHGGSHR